MTYGADPSRFQAVTESEGSRGQGACRLAVVESVASRIGHDLRDAIAERAQIGALLSRDVAEDPARERIHATDPPGTEQPGGEPAELRADAFAEQFLFQPLGIQAYSWWTYPDGTVQAGGGLALLPRDLARFGQLYLNLGTWEDQRIVSEDWVHASTTWPVSVAGSRERYGYQWWGINLPRHDNVFDLSDEILEAAAGRGGQWILVYPAMDLIVVFTGGNDNRLSDQPLDILRRYVFPAVLHGN